MVNMNKWEEIEFFEAKVGDTIKRVEKNKLLKSEIEGEVCSTFFDLYNGPTGSLTIMRNGFSHRFNRQTTGAPRGVKVYRRKPKAKPFSLPTKLFATIKGERIGHAGVFANLSLSHSGWVHRSGSAYTEDEIFKYYHNFEVVFEGITK